MPSQPVDRSTVWIIAVSHWGLTPLVMFNGLDNLEKERYTIALYSFSFVVANICLTLGLITGRRCLFQPIICLYLSLILAFSIKGIYLLCAFLLPNIYLVLLTKLKQFQGIDNDLGYDKEPSIYIMYSLQGIAMMLVISIASFLFASTIHRYQKSLEDTKASGANEKTLHDC